MLRMNRANTRTRTQKEDAALFLDTSDQLRWQF